MGKYSDALLGPGAAAAAPAPISSSANAAGYAASTAGAYIDDPGTRARFFAERRGIPVDRYRIVNGRPVYKADDGNEYYEEPDLHPISDPGSVLTAATSIPAAVTEAAPPLATGIVTAPMAIAGPAGLATSMGLTAAAGAGGKLLKESIGNSIAGEDQPGTAGRALRGAVEGGLGQGVGAGITAGLGRFAARDLPQLDLAAVNRLQSLANKQAITLTPAESTNLDSLKATQRLLTNMPASSGKMRKFFDDRAQGIQTAVGDTIDGFSPQDSGELAGRNLKEMALTAIQAAKNERESAAEPFYKTAMAEGGATIDPTAILQKIDAELVTAKGATRDALNRARTFFFRPDGPKPAFQPVNAPPRTPPVENSVAGLHSAKLALDDMLNGVDPKGPKAGGQDSTTFAKLTALKEDLTGLLNEASPSYRQGSETFQRMSDPVNGLQKGLVGVLARTEDANAHRALLNMFNPATTGPRALFEARIALSRMGREGVETWNEAKAAYLSNTWDAASKQSMSSSQGPGTAGAKFSAMLMGDQRQQRLLQSAMEPEQYRGISDLAEVLEATGRVPLHGSPTTWNTEALEQVKESSRPLVAKIVRNINPATFLKSFDQTATNWAMQGKLSKMADVYTSPDALRRLRELRVVQPGTARGVTALAQLASDIGGEFVSDVLATSSATVPPSQGPLPPQQAGQPPAPASSPRRSYSQQLGLSP